MRAGVIVACVLILAAALAPRAAQAAEPGWVTDKRAGCKVWDRDPDPKDTITWSGRCQNGMAQGPGVVEWLEDNVVAVRTEGEWRDGKLVGNGVLIFASGNRYEGEFVDGLRSGRGVYKWHNGDRFEGEYRDNTRNGHGVETFANGNRYDGEFRNGKPNGHGVYTLASGEVFDGIWMNGCYERDNRWAAVGVDAAACHH